MNLQDVLRRRNYRDQPVEKLPRCSAPAPDGSLSCAKEAGHLGWHEDRDTSWFSDVWAIDQSADTAEAAVDPEPTMSAEEWQRLQETLRAPEPEPERERPKAEAPKAERPKPEPEPEPGPEPPRPKPPKTPKAPRPPKSTPRRRARGPVVVHPNRRQRAEIARMEAGRRAASYQLAVYKMQADPGRISPLQKYRAQHAEAVRQGRCYIV